MLDYSTLLMKTDLQQLRHSYASGNDDCADRLAVALYNAGQINELSSLSTNIEPHSAVAWFVLGVSLHARHYDEAKEALEKAIELEEGYALAYYFRGIVAKDLYERNKEWFPLAFAIDPTFENAFEWICQNDLAAEAILRDLTQEQDRFFIQAFIEMRLANNTAPLEQLSKLGSEEAFKVLGDCFQDRSDLEASFRLLKAFPERTCSYFCFLGQAHEASNDSFEALAAYENALKFNEWDRWARGGKARVVKLILEKQAPESEGEEYEDQMDIA